MSQEDNLWEIHARFETPRDLEYEDYLNRARVFGGPSARMVDMERICDGCKKTIPFRQQGLDHKCKKCNLHFDLCTDCQKMFQLDLCPSGWGCGL